MWTQREGRTATVRTVWSAWVDEPGTHVIAGSEYWGISFIQRGDGSVGAELDGPRLAAREVTGIAGERYWGVELAPFVFVPGLDTIEVLDITTELPVRGADGRDPERVWIGGRWSPVPAVDDLEEWVDALVCMGALSVDEDIRAALGGDRVGASHRTWQRRYRRTVGLTAAQVERIKRVERAYDLLQQGRAPAEVAVECGFADQPHLTRSMRLIRGRTPANVIAASRGRPRPLR